MKKLLITISLLLSFGFTFSAVAAQTDGVQAPDVDMAGAEVEGAVSVYSRSYSVDFEAIMATPDLDTAELMKNIGIQGITFDSDDNAEKYIDDSRSEIDEALNSDEPVEGMEDMEISDLEGFDKDGIQIVMDMPDLEMAVVMIMFVDGDQVFQITIMDSDIEVAKTKANDVTQFVIDAETETDEVTFSEDGTSTGGVFDRMPKADDEIVGSLTTLMDMEIMAPAAE